jgi:hypothetical protein
LRLERDDDDVLLADNRWIVAGLHRHRRGRRIARDDAYAVRADRGERIAARQHRYTVARLHERGGQQ